MGFIETRLKSYNIILLWITVSVVNSKYDDKIYHDEHIFIPDAKYLQDFEAHPHAKSLEFFCNDLHNHIYYYLFTRKNPIFGQELILNNSNSIKLSNFDANTSTMVIVHGLGSDKDSELNILIKDACLNKKEENVIVVDWSFLSKQIYFIAILCVPKVGEQLGVFLQFLMRETGVSVDSMHLVGHSLGAHVVGKVSRTLNKKVARITGLDPAGPLWELHPERLTSTDAVYVEAIHTSASILGYGIIRTVGDVDIYANGGYLQPGCIFPSCSHSFSWKLFAASITFNKFVAKKCTIELFHSNCNGTSILMGNDNICKSGNGTFSIMTSDEYPYYLKNQ